VLHDVSAWFDEHLSLVPPRSALRKAKNYVHKQWLKLKVDLGDGAIGGANARAKSLQPD
jgi:hypothetical protein